MSQDKTTMVDRIIAEEDNDKFLNFYYDDESKTHNYKITKNSDPEAKCYIKIEHLKSSSGFDFILEYIEDISEAVEEENLVSILREIGLVEVKI